MKKLFCRLAVGAAFSLMSAVAWAVPVSQIGFVLDASGSVGATNYDKVRDGLNAALSGLPQDGTVEVTVVTYSSSAQQVVAPTVVDASTLAGIQNAISSHSYAGGLTNTEAGLDLLTSLMINSTNFADPGTTSAANLTTDGQSNVGTPGTASAAMAAAGIDSLSIEAIGSGLTSPAGQSEMLSLAFPGTPILLATNETNIPNPANGSWVVPVSDFDAYAAVVLAKVQAVVTPTPPVDVPEPGVFALMVVGVAGMVFTRRKQKAIS